MDYRFKYDYLGQPLAKFSMEHEAFGRWFSEELANNISLLAEVLKVISQIENIEFLEKTFVGREFELIVRESEVEVRALCLEFDVDEELPDNTEIFDNELKADCGLQDFKKALLSWQDFLIN